MMMLLERLALLEFLHSGSGIQSFIKKLAVVAACLFAVYANGGPTLALSNNSAIHDRTHQQAYQIEPMAQQPWVSGCVDKIGTGIIVGRPSGGNCTLTENYN